MLIPHPLPAGSDSFSFTELGATSYTAPAVNIDNSTPGSVFLLNESLTCTDNGLFSLSGWFLFSNLNNGNNIYVVDPVNSYVTYMQISYPDGLGGFEIDFGSLEEGFPELEQHSPAHVVTPDAWHHILWSEDSNTGIAALYVDDVRISLADLRNQSPFTAAVNGLPFYVFDDAYGTSFNGQAADVWIAPGVSLLDDNGLIPEATRRQFVSDRCQPVDPAGFPESAILFSGDASTFGDNQGTGGDFTLTGSLTDAATSPSNRAQVTLNGLKGGVYALMASAADWTNTTCSVLSPMFGFNLHRTTFSLNALNTNYAFPSGPMIVQTVGPHPVDVMVTRIQSTLADTQPTILNGIVDDTPFTYPGGCGYLGTVITLKCADWNSSSVDFQFQHPNGAWITIQTFSNDSQVGFTLPAGTYRLSGADTVNAPIYGTISPFNINSSETYNFVGITEVTAPFTLAGGVYGLMVSCADDTEGHYVNLYQIMPDGYQMLRQLGLNNASQSYLPGASYVLDPTDLDAPLTLSITAMQLQPTDTQSLILTDDSQTFQLQGAPLEYQIAVSCADWNGATIRLEVQSADGAWISANNTNTTESGILWPTTGAGTYRITGVSDLNAPLYVGIANTPVIARDGPFFFNNLTGITEFELQGGQYSLNYYLHDNSGAEFALNYQAPDGSWLNFNSWGDGVATSWQWFATGRYQLDASALTNPDGLCASISTLPL